MNVIFRFFLFMALLSLFGCGDNGCRVIFQETSAWNTPVTLSADQDSSGGQAVMDGEGNGLVVWGSDSRLYAKKYSVSQGWDSDMTRFDNAVLRAGALKIAMNENGEGVAVWRLEETGGDFFYARRFDMTSGWDDDAQRLCDNSYDGQRPDVSINSGGNILTVFSKYTTNDVYARSYTPGSDWDAGPTVIDSLNRISNYPKVALDETGNGVAVWEQYDGTYTNAHATYFSKDTGWDGTVTMIDDPAVDGTVGQAYVLLNADGSGAAFWDQQNGASYEIYARTFETGSTIQWDTGVFQVTSSTGYTHGARGAIAPDGTILISWMVMDGTRYQMYARSYSPATGWAASAQLVSDDSLDLNVEAAFVAFDKDGKGLAVWSQDRETEPAVYARDYTIGTGWSSEIQKVYEYPDGFGGLVTSLSMGPGGKTLITIDYFDMPDYNSGQTMAIFSK